jgi:hypothetical protein
MGEHQGVGVSSGTVDRVVVVEAAMGISALPERP